MIDLLLPSTDGAALAQAIIAGAVFTAVLVVVRRSPDLLWFVSGLGVVTFGWFALRTVH